VTYWSGAADARHLYVALTNRCNARTLPETRGPGFAMASFSPLSPPDWEPSEDDVVAAVSRALDGEKAAGREAAFPPLCFAGLGEPLLRASILVGATSRLRSAHPALSVRISTNGLFAHPGPLVAMLADAGVSSVSVALAASDAPTYCALMRPNDLCDTSIREPGAAFEAVCTFIRLAVESGLDVECTAVAGPGVDALATEALARQLGASGWRVRQHFP